jgi:hypothetical protein
MVGRARIKKGAREMARRDSVVAARFEDGRSTRRTWLFGLGVSVLGSSSERVACARQTEEKRSPPEAGEIAQVQQKLADAGLGRSKETRSEHFLGLGNAPLPFRREALARCEELSQAFLAHFRACGFTLEYPPGRLTVIALKDQDSYAALLGEAPGKDVGGHYDVETNRLVIFDFRARRDDLAPQAERVNLFTLVHETAHQLTFNTGILSRAVDVPLSISEGLATYVELWRPGVKNSIGGRNTPRMRAVQQAGDWIPIGDLLSGDSAFEPETEQLAYAESWILMHYFLRTSARQPKLRTYLADLRAAKNPGDRGKIAEKTLGPLARLDRELKEEARKYLRG